MPFPRLSSTPQSACLDDKSTHVAELKFPDQLPGQLYDADVQCKWQFGNSAQLCQYDFGKVNHVSSLAGRRTLL